MQDIATTSADVITTVITATETITPSIPEAETSPSDGGAVPPMSTQIVVIPTSRETVFMSTAVVGTGEDAKTTEVQVTSTAVDSTSSVFFLFVCF
jgi:hypothetical protein